MAKRKTTERKVIVAFTLGGAAGRSCLSGVFDYVNEGHDRNIQLVQHPDEIKSESKVNRSLLTLLASF